MDAKTCLSVYPEFSLESSTGETLGHYGCYRGYHSSQFALLILLIGVYS